MRAASHGAVATGRNGRGSAFAALALVVVSTLGGCGSGETSQPSVSAGPASLAPTASSAAVGSPDLSASPAASDATSAELEQLLSQVMSTPVDVSDPGPTLERVEQGLKDFMRKESGVADLLGPDGATILAELDGAERQAVDAVVAKVQAQSVAPGTGGLTPTATFPAAGTIPEVDVARQQASRPVARFASIALPGGSGPRPLQSEGEYLFGIILITSMAPAAFADVPRDSSGNYVGPGAQASMTTEHGVTNTMTMTPTLHGSKMVADLKLDSGVATGPLNYREEATGTVTVDLCPDVNGNVALEVSLSYSVSLLGGGMEINVKVKQTGRVDDTATLATTGEQIDASMAVQPLIGNDTLGTAPWSFEYTRSYTVDPGGRVSNVNEDVPRSSWHVDLRLARDGMNLARTMGSVVEAGAMNSAESKWKNGYCVAITVAGMEGTMKVDDPRGRAVSMGVQIDVPSKRVDVGTEEPFTAAVTHKFEGGQLNAPVTATLSSGAVSVTPSGTGVPAPATFRYKAPDEPYMNAVVTLETVSRRGKATLMIAFRSFPPGWVYAPGSSMEDGKKCSDLDGDWVVNVHYTAGGFTQTGKFVVTIDGTTLNGTYVYDQRQTAPDGSLATWHGTGDASIVLQPDGSVAMSFHGGTTTITQTLANGGTSSQTLPGPEGQMFIWQRATTECR